MLLLSLILSILPLFAPHTWNAADAIDDTPGYQRGEQTYEVRFPLQVSRDSAYLICFDGVNQEAWVSLNGHELGYHVGGYTRFYYDATRYVVCGENRLTVRVSNAYNADIPPLSADFTFFGGIYRPAYLRIVSRAYIEPDGVVIRTPQVTHESAEIVLSTTVKNACSAYRIHHTLLSESGEVVAAGEERVKGAACKLYVAQPHLWSPKRPELYTLRTQLCDKKGKVLDEVENPVGLRYYHFDPETGFYLNGEPLKLIGTNRHQDEAGYGNALAPWQHERDIRLVKEMGGNFLRVSHYPQDRRIMQLCDSLGILCSVEIPVVNAITENEAFADNCLHMLDEMIAQNRNHPSVIIWAYMNEILLRPPFRDTPERDSLYRVHATELAARLDARCHQLDPERYTMIAFHDNMKLYNACGMTSIPDIVGMNLYQGWYSGGFGGFDKALERQHELMPTKPIIVTEYGADCDTRIRSEKPVRFDYSTDYSLRFHQHYLQTILQTPYVAGANVWNLNDFQSEGRAGAIPHFNLKGLTTTHREPKVTYWYYRSQLHTDAVARAEAVRTIDSLLRMPVAQEWPKCVLLGTDRSFYDTETSLLWQPEQAYSEGQHGYIGGKRFSVTTNHGRLPAADADIAGTHADPVYQTARIGIEAYRFDVPDGDYELTLLFAELEQKGEVAMSAYNLGSKVLDTGFQGRAMAIEVNGETLCRDWAPEWNQAENRTVRVHVTEGKGICVRLASSLGETILNAIQLNKL